MIKAKVKVFDEQFSSILQNNINEFLNQIDIRQVIKTEYSTAYGSRMCFSAIIYYVEFEDIRDAKIESVLDIK
jgi:hypothetical protein